MLGALLHSRAIEGRLPKDAWKDSEAAGGHHDQLLEQHAPVWRTYKIVEQEKSGKQLGVDKGFAGKAGLLF